MGAICHITPVLNDILDLCRFDLTYLTPPPTKISQDAFRHITRASSSRTGQKVGKSRNFHQKVGKSRNISTKK